MSFITATGIILSLSVVSAAVISRLSAPDPKDDVPQVPAAPAGQPAHIDEPQHISAFGFIVPWREIYVASPLDDRPVGEVLVETGDHIDKGQVLARFDITALRHEIGELQARLNDVSENLSRGFSSPTTDILDQQDCRDLSMEKKAVESLLARAAMRLSDATVLAPASGTITARSIRRGDIPAAGKPLFAIACDDRLEWVGTVATDQAARVKAYQDVTLALPDGSTCAGEVRSISPLFNQGDRLTTLTVMIRTTGTAQAGMYVKGTITLDE